MAPAPELGIQASFLPRLSAGDLLISRNKRIGGLSKAHVGGRLLRHNLNGLRIAQRLALSAAVSALATAGLVVGSTKPALAEFEIQESSVEKGRVETEYRGAFHWGIPKAEKAEAGDGGGEGTTEEEGPLRQSHDLEVEYGIADRWLFSATLSADEPIGENFALSVVGFELQYELIEREGNGLGLAFTGSYGIATRGGDADEIEFGPIVELASGKLLLTFNPFFTAQAGDNRQTDGLGFEYGWRAEYDFAKHWGVGVEMFGQIEDLANAGSFNDQEHSIGPTMFYKLGNDDEDSSKSDDDGHNNRTSRAPEMELSLNAGLQFGLTDVTSDTALKFQATLEF